MIVAPELAMRVQRSVDEVRNGRNCEAAAALRAGSAAIRFERARQCQTDPPYHETFLDLHAEEEDLIVADDTVVLRLRGTGRTSNDAHGFP